METMNCARAKDLLQLYLDGTLEPPEAQDLEVHVAACAACRGELVQLERLMLSIESLPRISAPPDMLLRTMAAIGHHSRWERSGRLFGWMVNAAAVAGMAAGLALAVGSADDAFEALMSLLVDDGNPVGLIDGLLAVAASIETPLVAGIGLLVGAGCLTLSQLFTASQEASAS